VCLAFLLYHGTSSCAVLCDVIIIYQSRRPAGEQSVSVWRQRTTRAVAATSVARVAVEDDCVLFDRVAMRSRS